MFETPNPWRFVESLDTLGSGMLGIMIVMGIIITATILINKLSSKKKNSDD